jgi:hypothetical protein
MKNDMQFEWGSRQEESFQKIKEILTAAPVLAYYDVRKPVTITCDASKSGLGAVLLQDSKPIAYASRALTDAETRYTQIEKELLAVVFGFERFNQYTYARPVEVEMDHKPLEAITKKPLSMAPPCLQRMLLRLQRYDFIAKYKPGKKWYSQTLFPEHTFQTQSQMKGTWKTKSNIIHTLFCTEYLYQQINWRRFEKKHQKIRR